MWQQAERRFAERVPFPRTHRFDEGALARDFVTVRVEPADDPRWHFTLRVSGAAQVEALTGSSEVVAQTAATMSTVRLPQPETSIDVIGMRLPGEVDVAAWLDEWLDQAGMVPHSSRPQRTARGVMGDVVATFRSSAGPQVVRYTTVRFGERTFLLVLRSPLATYRLVAREFVLAVATLRPVIG